MDALIRVDPVTGLRTVVSGCRDVGCTSKRGSGPGFAFPRGIIFEDDGNMLVCDGDLNGENNIKTIFRVDPTEGDRTVLSSDLIGTGPAFDTLFDVILDADGNVLAADTQVDTIFRVDPVTGNRSIMASNSVGTGPTLKFPGDMALESDGNVLITEGADDMVLRVDPANGNRTVVSSSLSSNPRGTGIALVNLGGIAIEADGKIVVADEGQDAVIRIDPSSGNRTEVSGPLVGIGPLFTHAISVDVDSDGNIYVADDVVGVIKVNPSSGDRELISESGAGGIPITQPRDVRMQTVTVLLSVPAASPLVTVLIGLLMAGGAAVVRFRS